MEIKTAKAIGTFIGRFLAYALSAAVFVFAVWVAIGILKQIGAMP